MTGRARKRLVNVVRIVVCAGALAIVLRGVTLDDRVTLASGEVVAGTVTATVEDAVALKTPTGLRTIATRDIAKEEDGALAIRYGLRSAWTHTDKTLLLLALLVHLPVVLPQTLRFRLMLGAQAIALSFWECLKLTIAGNFLNFATPFGATGGDVFKAYFVSLHTHHKTEAVTTVIIDRVVGLAGLLVVVAIITVVSPDDSKVAVLRPYMLTMLGAGIAGAVVYFAPPIRRRVPVEKILSKLPAGEHFQRVDTALTTFASRKLVLLQAILLTVFLQAMALSAYFLVARAVGLDAHLGNLIEFFAYFYTGVVVQSLPGPPQGLGTVELAYRYFFSEFGSASQIVFMALLIRLVAFGASLPGFLVTITGSYRPGELDDLADAAEQGERDDAMSDAAQAGATS